MVDQFIEEKPTEEIKETTLEENKTRPKEGSSHQLRVTDFGETLPANNVDGLDSPVDLKLDIGEYVSLSMIPKFESKT